MSHEKAFSLLPCPIPGDSLSQDHLRLTMSADAQPEPQKIGAVVYLSSNRPLHLPNFFAEFHKNWPLGLLEKTGKELHRAFFRARGFSAECRRRSLHVGIIAAGEGPAKQSSVFSRRENQAKRRRRRDGQ